MSTTVDAWITDLDLVYPNAYTDANKVVFVNNVELSIYEDIHEEHLTQYWNKDRGVYAYSLPTGCLWEDVEGLWVDGKEYNKKSVLHNKDIYSFYYDQSKLNLSPVPTLKDVEYVSGASEVTFKAISYTSGASEFTFTHNTITTTGTAFTASSFVVGMTVFISGCLDTGNNHTAVIETVAASVLTFADNSFDADTTADTGTISLKTNGIYASGAEFDGFKVGSTALVSGCTDETANNIYARIYAVEDNFLTFALDTFTAQAETSAVTIKQPNIKMVYKYRRTQKAVGDIATDTLLLPDRFKQIYYDYACAQMAKYNRDFAEYNNWMDFYNAGIADYETWYGNNKEQAVANMPEDAWG